MRRKGWWNSRSQVLEESGKSGKGETVAKRKKSFVLHNLKIPQVSLKYDDQFREYQSTCYKLVNVRNFESTY